MTLQQLEREMVAQPIRSLQYMLNRLSLRYDFLPALVPDGVFGERTLEAVMLFQRELHPLSPAWWTVRPGRPFWTSGWIWSESLPIPDRYVLFLPVLKFRPVPPTTTFSRYRPCFRASPMSWMGWSRSPSTASTMLLRSGIPSGSRRRLCCPRLVSWTERPGIFWPASMSSLSSATSICAATRRTAWQAPPRPPESRPLLGPGGPIPLLAQKSLFSPAPSGKPSGFVPALAGGDKQKIQGGPKKC